MNKVIVYGAGTSARYFIDKYEKKYDIQGVCARTPDEIKDISLPFIDIEKLTKRTDCKIVVASWAILDISKRLLEKGISQFRIMWFQHNKNQLLDWQQIVEHGLHRELKKADVLYAFYDLDVARATYDILAFLCMADKVRRDKNLVSLHIVIVAASNNEFNIAGKGIISTQEHDWRKRQILMQCCGLLGAVSGITMTSTREEASHMLESSQQHFPTDYCVEKPVACWEFNHLFAMSKNPTDIAVLSATNQAKEAVTQWLKRCSVNSRKVVTITLRQSSIKPARNSNMDAWKAFIAKLNKTEFFPVIIPDSEMLDCSIFDSEVFYPACFNVEVRMAMYQMAWINLGVNNGPLHLCVLSHDVPYIMFKQVTEDYQHSSTQSFIDRGFDIGEDFPVSSAVQKLVWQDDNLDVIENAFYALVQQINELN